MAEQSFVVKGKLLNVVGQLPHCIIGLLKATENIFEHTRGGAGGRHELHLTIHGGFSKIFDAFIFLSLSQDIDPSARSGRSVDFHPGKTLSEILQLLVSSHNGVVIVNDQI